MIKTQQSLQMKSTMYLSKVSKLSGKNYLSKVNHHFKDAIILLVELEAKIVNKYISLVECTLQTKDLTTVIS
jgi:hypothetical protein